MPALSYQRILNNPNHRFPLYLELLYTVVILLRSDKTQINTFWGANSDTFSIKSHFPKVVTCPGVETVINHLNEGAQAIC